MFEYILAGATVGLKATTLVHNFVDNSVVVYLIRYSPNKTTTKLMKYYTDFDIQRTPEVYMMAATVWLAVYYF